MPIKKLLPKKDSTVFLLFIVIAISFILRIYSLNNIPVNIIGDEAWDLSNVFRIIYQKNFSAFFLLGDGSVSALVFYPVALFTKLLGDQDSILFLRLNIIAYSILALIAFFYILKDKTSEFFAFTFTLLLSANYVFLNFSRTAWVNMMAVFSGLFMIYFIEKAIDKQNLKMFAYAGIFAGLSMYGYHYGRVLVATLTLFLFFFLIRKHFTKQLIKGFIVFLIFTFFVSLPFIFSIISDKGNSLASRPQGTFAFSSDKISANGGYIAVLTHQLKYTTKGIILLDGSVMSEGFENPRYLPFKTPPVNPFIKIFFIFSLIYFLIKRRFAVWWLIILSIVITQYLSDWPPNYSRALFYIPVIYFFAGTFIYNIIKNKRKLAYKIDLNILVFLIAVIIFFHDVFVYFSWMKNSQTLNTRQPSITYEEYPRWRDYQINAIKNGEGPRSDDLWRTQ